MRTYLLYIHDDRYATPTLDVIVAADDSDARVTAVARLAASPHYRQADIWEDDRSVARIMKEASD